MNCSAQKDARGTTQCGSLGSRQVLDVGAQKVATMSDSYRCRDGWYLHLEAPNVQLSEAQRAALESILSGESLENWEERTNYDRPHNQSVAGHRPRPQGR